MLSRQYLLIIIVIKESSSSASKLAREVQYGVARGLHRVYTRHTWSAMMLSAQRSGKGLMRVLDGVEVDRQQIQETQDVLQLTKKDLYSIEVRKIFIRVALFAICHIFWAGATLLIIIDKVA